VCAVCGDGEVVYPLIFAKDSWIKKSTEGKKTDIRGHKDKAAETTYFIKAMGSEQGEPCLSTGGLNKFKGRFFRAKLPADKGTEYIMQIHLCALARSLMQT
jgi:hypothetical protein